MKAYFAGGCFWCLEAVFQRVKGVSRVASGYAGGPLVDPTYEQVSSGTTGHAETVEIEFDPEKIGYNTLLEMFFTIHDPTTLNRQGNDVGEQYRSVIFFVNPEQQQQATEAIEHLTVSKAYPDPIVTEVRPLDRFYTAEQYHQNYFNANQQQPYCQLIISPKIKKFEKEFAEFLMN